MIGGAANASQEEYSTQQLSLALKNEGCDCAGSFPAVFTFRKIRLSCMILFSTPKTSFAQLWKNSRKWKFGNWPALKRLQMFHFPRNWPLFKQPTSPECIPFLQMLLCPASKLWKIHVCVVQGDSNKHWKFISHPGFLTSLSLACPTVVWGMLTVICAWEFSPPCLF